MLKWAIFLKKNPIYKKNIDQSQAAHLIFPIANTYGFQFGHCDW